jgi:hypothetical protein
MPMKVFDALREALAHLGLRGGGSVDLAPGRCPAKRETALQNLLIEAFRKAVEKRTHSVTD